jgi:hypothetical protein
MAATPTVVQPRLSFDDLERFIAVEYGSDDQVQFVGTVGAIPRRLTDGYISVIIDVSRYSVLRYRRHDIPFWSADKIAGRLDTHPCFIWPDFHHHTILLEDEWEKEFVA